MPENVKVLGTFAALDLTTEASTVVYTADGDIQVTALVFRRSSSAGVTEWPEVSFGTDEDAENMALPIALIGLSSAGDVFVVPASGKTVTMEFGHELAVKVATGAVAGSLEASIDVLGYVIA